MPFVLKPPDLLCLICCAYICGTLASFVDPYSLLPSVLFVHLSSCRIPLLRLFRNLTPYLDSAQSSCHFDFVRFDSGLLRLLLHVTFIQNKRILIFASLKPILLYRH